MSRLAAILDDDGTTILASYEYVGAGTVVTEDHEGPDVKLDYNANGNLGGFERFGRVVDQVWEILRFCPRTPPRTGILIRRGRPDSARQLLLNPADWLDAAQPARAVVNRSVLLNFWASMLDHVAKEAGTWSCKVTNRRRPTMNCSISRVNRGRVPVRSWGTCPH
jgi:hypothetical protein